MTFLRASYLGLRLQGALSPQGSWGVPPSHCFVSVILYSPSRRPPRGYRPRGLPPVATLPSAFARLTSASISFPSQSLSSTLPNRSFCLREGVPPARSLRSSHPRGVKSQKQFKFKELTQPPFNDNPDYRQLPCGKTGFSCGVAKHRSPLHKNFYVNLPQS